MKDPTIKIGKCNNLLDVTRVYDDYNSVVDRLYNVLEISHDINRSDIIIVGWQIQYNKDPVILVDCFRPGEDIRLSCKVPGDYLFMTEEAIQKDVAEQQEIRKKAVQARREKRLKKLDELGKSLYGILRELYTPDYDPDYEPCEDAKETDG